MSDRTHLKILAVLWAACGIGALATGNAEGMGQIIFALAGVAYLASFFARSRA